MVTATQPIINISATITPVTAITESTSTPINNKPDEMNIDITEISRVMPNDGLRPTELFSEYDQSENIEQETLYPNIPTDELPIIQVYTVEIILFDRSKLLI